MTTKITHFQLGREWFHSSWWRASQSVTRSSLRRGRCRNTRHTIGESYDANKASVAAKNFTAEKLWSARGLCQHLGNEQQFPAGLSGFQLAVCLLRILQFVHVPDAQLQLSFGDHAED